MGRTAALVTGAASGIGRSVADLLARHMFVLAADKSPGGDASTPDREPIELDVTDEGSWHRVADRIRELGIPLAALVHNAGIALIKPAPVTTPGEFREVVETNLVSVFMGTRVLWDQLVAARASIVCVGSVAAVVGQDSSLSYVASKGGLVSMVRALAVELAPHSVRVNAVSPGPVNTPLLTRHFASIENGEEARSKLIKRIPIGRLLEPEDVAPLIEFLCLEASRAITGAHFIVDGGLTATFDYGSSFSGGRS